MLQHPFFAGKQILVIDADTKSHNDRTWCFWEQGQGLFEPVVHHQWKQIDFFSTRFSARFDLDPYAYKMIRGIDFYQYVLQEAKQHSHVYFVTGKVQSVQNEQGRGTVIVDDTVYTAEYVFNSIVFTHAAAEKTDGYYYLLQHFKGWLIETPDDCFSEKVATFMDFRVPQQRGTSFVYMLPVSPRKALVEYNQFTETLLQQDEYDKQLKEYIQSTLQLERYRIVEEEFGIIPMTNYPFSKGEGQIVNIGTAGGHTKGSSGFTFQFIQKNTAAIVNALVQGKDPHINNAWFHKRFNLYDSTLLRVLQYRALGGDQVFADLFQRNKPQQVLKFLDNETNLIQELKILQTVPTGVFLPAALKEIFHF